MQIGNQIKQRRIKLEMTQEDLAKALNVSRSTISNWEGGRNYPDIQLVIKLSKILDLSLESLLQEDSDVVDQISSDTKNRKRISKHLKISYICSAILALFIIISAYVISSPAEITHLDYIESAKILDVDSIAIKTVLPKYRSLVSYYVGTDPEDAETLQVTLVTRIDVSLRNKNEIIIDCPISTSYIKKYVLVGNDKSIGEIVINNSLSE